MQTLSEIITRIQLYMLSLDWAYILTFIIITYGINNFNVKAGLQQVTGTQTRTRYRVALVGIVYGCCLYVIRGYTLIKVESLFQSFVFALVFHKFIVEALIYWLVKRGLPGSISKHLLNENQLQALNTEK